MIKRLDHWVGKTLFVPIVIRICQWRGITQWAFSKYAWMTAMFCWLAAAPAHGFTLIVLYCVMALITVLNVFTAARHPDMPDYCMPAIFRVMCLFFLIQEGMLCVVEGLRLWVAYWLLVAFAEYARTIDTIPPLEVEEKAPTLVPARERAK